MSAKPFPNYLELTGRVPPGVWRVVRVATVAASIGLCVLLVVDPQDGLRLWWRVTVPLLPLIWFLAPGVWRNSCPLSATNQAPRILKLTRGWTAPDWFRAAAPVVGMTAFFAIVILRPSTFDHHGPATAALIASALVLAFLGGLLLKGKSGWCSSICPLLPVQRMYGQTPLVAVPNAHCRPCVGCTKNCYDFNPRVAHLADLHDEDPRWGLNRKFFAGAFPGLVYGFNTVDSTGWVHARDMLVAMAVGAGSFTALEVGLRISAPKLAAAYAGAALNLFYWWAAPVLSTGLLGSSQPAFVWPLRAVVLVLTADWLRRTVRAESDYHEELVRNGRMLTIRPVSLGAEAAAAAARTSGEAALTFDDGDRVEVAAGASVLEVAEGAGKSIEAGCRMGVCGADPVCVRSGGENLSPMGADERATLERLGLSPECHRLACSARVEGPAEISLTPDRSVVHTPAVAFEFDPEVRRVVIVGNGIAGVTTADHLRRRHPEVEIDVVAAEPHTLYNRMGISRLIYGRSAMIGLHLLPDEWYDEHRITCWLNTRVARIDRGARSVHLATGEELPYDRLVLATGSEARRPPIPGLDHNGFVLRSSADAVAIRQFCQVNGARTAVVAGGGLLGVEAAYALHKLGLGVTILERGPWLLGRQVDAAAGDLLGTYLHNLGIEVQLGAAVAEVRGGERTEVVLEDGRVLDSDVFLVAAGVQAATGLAVAAGLETDRGVLVDDHLRTSDPAVFAVGDVAEYGGEHFGLWPAAVQQAEICAENVAGGDRTYTGHTPVTLLKVVGVDLASAGLTAAPTGGSEHASLDLDELRYKKVVLDADGRVCGAILLGHPGDGPAVIEAVRNRLEPGSVGALRELVPEHGDSLEVAV